MEMWIDAIVKIVFIILGVVSARYLVPWLKAKGLYAIVKKAVNAAEKWAENNDINKKEWVIEKLKAMGVKITPAVDVAIESAVEELDIALGKGKKNKGE